MWKGGDEIADRGVDEGVFSLFKCLSSTSNAHAGISISSFRSMLLIIV